LKIRLRQERRKEMARRGSGKKGQTRYVEPEE